MLHSSETVQRIEDVSRPILGKSAQYISLALAVAAVMAWWGVTKHYLKTLPALRIKGVSPDLIQALVVTAVSLLWSANIAQPALPVISA